MILDMHDHRDFNMLLAAVRGAILSQGTAIDVIMVEQVRKVLPELEFQSIGILLHVTETTLSANPDKRQSPNWLPLINEIKAIKEVNHESNSRS